MHGMRRNGIGLAVMGIAGLGFFLLSDPRYGVLRGSQAMVIDRANDSMMGTAVGLAASAVVLGIGLWLVTRRRV